MLAGHVDIAGHETVAGWAADEAAPEECLRIVLLVDGEPRQHAEADGFRGDLLELGRYGAGRHGFTFHLAPSLAPDRDHRIEVRVGSATGALLAPGPIRLHAAPSPPARPVAHQDRGDLPHFLIHVGPYKTGTTYLQHSLAAQRAWLRARGIVYPETWTTKVVRSHSELVSAIARHAPDLPGTFEGLRRSGARLVVLSAENFSDQSTDTLCALRGLIAPARASVLFYCRRWSELLFSGWQETLKHGHVMPLPEFCVWRLANQQGATLVNFALTLDRMAAAFGMDALRIVSYSNLVDGGHDLLDHFSSAVLDIQRIPAPPIRINESLDIYGAELLRALNVLHIGAGHPMSDDIYERFYVHRAELDLTGIFSAMEASASSFKMNEGVPGLSPIHAEIAAKYASRLMNPTPDGLLFRPLSKDIAFVGGNYLLQPGTIDLLRDIYDVLLAYR